MKGMHRIVFFVPVDYVEAVKEALFLKGAGRYESYRRVSWQVLGEGQFEPTAGSNPFIGTQGELERVAEFRVEMICADEVLPEVLDELVRVHPYEEVAYYAVKTTT